MVVVQVGQVQQVVVVRSRLFGGVEERSVRSGGGLPSRNRRDVVVRFGQTVLLVLGGPDGRTYAGHYG